jgi:hypothetical protein
MPSEDSSSDDPVCRCGHIKSDHKDSGEGSCCYQHRAPYYCHAFEPKANDAAPCRCGHPASSHYGAQGCIGNRNLCPCKGYLPQGGAEEPEPPKAAMPDWCDACQQDGPCACDPEPEAASPPRPPYAVAYSVGGQLYEAWLPGDATAVAEDGVLKIAHAGQVAGIVRVSPVKEG